MNPTGKYIMLIGALIFIIGLIWYLLGNKMNWFGRLPGDIRIERENVRIYFPIVTMILVSVILSLLVYLLRKFF